MTVVTPSTISRVLILALLLAGCSTQAQRQAEADRDEATRLHNIALEEGCAARGGKIEHFYKPHATVCTINVEAP